MDFEATLRELVNHGVASKAQIGLSPEGRVLLRIEADNGQPAGFVIVENTAHPVEIPAPGAPPPQRVDASGFDAHRGMGERQ